MNDYNGRNGNGYQPLPTPPTTEYSERRQLQDKIREAEQRFDLAYSQACSKFTRIINESNLTVQEKQDILDQLWK